MNVTCKDAGSPLSEAASHPSVCGSVANVDGNPRLYKKLVGNPVGVADDLHPLNSPAVSGGLNFDESSMQELFVCDGNFMRAVDDLADHGSPSVLGASSVEEVSA